MDDARAPEIRELLARVAQIAAQWRRTEDAQGEAALKAAYGATIEQLHALGWDGNMPVDSLLSPDRMPEVYARWYPGEANPTTW